MKLIDYMRSENLGDAAMAELVGGISEHGIRKLKYGERGPSIDTAIRIEKVTDGSVGLRDWVREDDGESNGAVSQASGAHADMQSVGA